MAARLPDNMEMMTLPGLLRHWARTMPDATALREKHLGIWRRISFAEYYRNVLDCALGLSALGFKRGDFLAIAGDDSPEWMYADLATQALGGSCIGVYPTNPWPELRYILQHSGSAFVVCGDQEQTDKMFDVLDKGGALPNLRKIICVDMKGMRKYDHSMLMSFDDLLALGRREREAGEAAVEAMIDALSPEDIAVIVYTSGTTGLPKGAMLSHRGLIHGAMQIRRLHGIDSDSWSVLAYLPLCHVAERLCSTVMQLVNGSSVSFAESVDTVARDLREVAPRAFLGVPRIWEKLQQSIMVRMQDTRALPRWVLQRCLALGGGIAERRLARGGRFAGIGDRLLAFALWVICFRALQKRLGLDRARICLCGGAPISPEVLRFFWGIGIRVYQVYGMTELCGVSHSQRAGSTLHGSVGEPLPTFEQRLGPDGEILVRTRAMFSGYLNDETAFQQAVHDGWMHTGDIGRLAEDGSLYVTDRKKDIIITSGGKNVTPSLIENRLKDSIYVREAILIGDGRHFLSTLIEIDYDTVGKWAQGKGLAYTNYKSLSGLPEVRELIGGWIAEVNTEFARVESIRKFEILPKQLDHDDGEVTATMKVRRSAIEKIYAAEIQRIYQSVGVS